MKTAKQKLEELLATSDYKDYLTERSLATDLAVQIKMQREANGFTQEKLAQKMGVQQSTVARLEKGVVGISTATLQKCCTALGLKLSLEKYKSVTKDALSNPLDVAKCIVECVQSELKECYDVTHLKLQKLLYYVQLHYLGQFSHPFIQCDFQAWEHGPVCPQVYKNFRRFNKQIISVKDVNGDSQKLTENDRELVENVMIKYAKLSAWQLREKTHSETPWINAWGKGENTLISLEDMKLFYDVFEVLS